MVTYEVEYAVRFSQVRLWRIMENTKQIIHLRGYLERMRSGHSVSNAFNWRLTHIYPIATICMSGDHTIIWFHCIFGASLRK